MFNKISLIVAKLIHGYVLLLHYRLIFICSSYSYPLHFQLLNNNIFPLRLFYHFSIMLIQNTHVALVFEVLGGWHQEKQAIVLTVLQVLHLYLGNLKNFCIISFLIRTLLRTHETQNQDKPQRLFRFSFGWKPRHVAYMEARTLV